MKTNRRSNFLSLLLLSCFPFTLLTAQPFAGLQPDLYVISVGTDVKDLYYTEQDARDFSNLFIYQNGYIYRRAYRENLIGTEATAQMIREKIHSLQQRAELGQIRSTDVIFFFLSSHGFLDEEKRLRVQGSDFDPYNVRATSLELEDDIVAPLDALPCQVVLFIDACHSALDSKSEHLETSVSLDSLMRKSLVVIISSSGRNELSYEHDVWKNGVFTEAIQNGLKSGRADSDGNRIITLGELYVYIRNTVPELLRHIGRAGQNPDKKLAVLDALPIYYRLN